jgi:enoyl-CoA hydratase/carnithine racemase
MRTENIQLEKKNFIATIMLNRPEKLNAVTPAMADALREAAAEVNADPAIRVVVLTGAGPKSFCAGSDIKELDDYETPWEFRNRPDYCDAIRDIRKPIICAVNGYCLGGGLELAMTCDIRIASENAIFGAPEIKLGWVGGGGMAFALAHSIGPSNAAMMLYTGDPVDAKKALSWGIISEVIAIEGLVSRACEIASVVAQRPPIAAQTAKINLRAAYSMTREDAVRYERDLQTICFATEDAAEGRRAFKEKRNPTFLGK